MNNKQRIKEDLRKQLLEKKGDTHDYGCVMLSLQIGKGQWKTVQTLVEDEDIYTEEGDQSYGREDEPHITILYGLHNDIPDAKIEALIDEIKPTEVTLKKISIFENDKFDVVKFDIIGESKDKLSKMNSMFTDLPHTTDYPDYHPHATIAYVKAGTGKKYVQTLSNDDSIDMNCVEVVYSKANGTKNKYKLK